MRVCDKQLIYANMLLRFAIQYGKQTAAAKHNAFGCVLRRCVSSLAGAFLLEIVLEHCGFFEHGAPSSDMTRKFAVLQRLNGRVSA